MNATSVSSTDDTEVVTYAAIVLLLGSADRIASLAAFVDLLWQSGMACCW